MPPARLVLYLATAGGIAMAIVSVVYRPPPGWIIAAALIAYPSLAILGVTFSRFGMYADVLIRGPAGARGVALTFDDGPDPRSTRAVLERLDAAGARATFFVIGRKAAAHPELLRAIADAGHSIGIHSYTHERFLVFRPPGRVRAELERAAEQVEQIVGRRPSLFRAPIGHVSPAMAQVARKMRLAVVGWSVRGVDGWSGARPEAVAARVTRKLRDGAIVLLHDAAERGDFIPASIEALPAIVAAAKQRDLPLVPLDQWLG